MKDKHLFYPRGITGCLESLLKEFPVVVLTGARQTGKSTLVQHISQASQRVYRTLDDLDILERATRTPDALLEEEDPITLDEVQRAPKLLLAIKRKVDKDRSPGRFLLTGSANLLLMKKVSETLAGRAIYLTLRPLTENEKSGKPLHSVWSLLAQSRSIKEFVQTLHKTGEKRGAALSWKKSILAGGYPSAVLVRSPEQRIRWMEGYVRTYLERDIQQLSEIGNLVDFRRLMQTTTYRLGQLMNQAEMARDAGLTPATAYRYLNLLEISYAVEKIPAYFVNRTKRLIKSPKFYWGDTGLACFLCGVTTEEELDALPHVGAMVENWVLRQMDVWRETTLPRPPIFYWRTAAGEEVDFVIEIKNRLIPIEVKSGKKVYFNDIKNLRSFIAEYSIKVPFGVVIYCGEEIQMVDKNIVAIPIGFL